MKGIVFSSSYHAVSYLPITVNIQSKSVHVVCFLCMKPASQRIFMKAQLLMCSPPSFKRSSN